MDFNNLFAQNLESVRRPGTSELVADVLRQKISDGDLPPGTQLAEEALSESLQVSRNSLREAFRLLSHERLITHEPHRGVFVRRLSREDVLQVYSARSFIEVAAIANCPASSAELRTALSVVEQAEVAAERGDWGAVATFNLAFHQALADTVGSPRITEIMEQLLAEVRLAFHSMDDARAFLEPYIPRNRAIVEQILHGNAVKAAQMMSEYLADSREQLYSALGLN